MIKIHYVTDVRDGEVTYTEANRWGTIKSGEIITKNEDNGI